MTDYHGSFLLQKLVELYHNLTINAGYCCFSTKYVVILLCKSKGNAVKNIFNILHMEKIAANKLWRSAVFMLDVKEIDFGEELKNIKLIDCGSLIIVNSSYIDCYDDNLEYMPLSELI